MGRLRYLVIYLSLILGMILMIMPLPDWAQMFRPNWVALILIYWSMALPKRVGLWFGLITGLMVDSLLGTLLGQHGLALIVVIYLNSNFYQRVRVLSLAQQAIYVFILLVINQFIIAWVDGIVGHSIPVQAFVSAPFVGMLIWPWVFVRLRDLRRKAMLS